FPNNVGSSDGSIVATPSSTSASEANLGRAALDLVVDPENVTAGGAVQGTLDALGINDPAFQAWLVGKLADGTGIKITVEDQSEDPEETDYKVVISVDGLVVEIENIAGLSTALDGKVPTTRTIAGVNLADNITADELRPALGITSSSFGFGSEGDVTISSNTTVTSDVLNGFKHYRNLTVNAGV